MNTSTSPETGLPPGAATSPTPPNELASERPSGSIHDRVIVITGAVGNLGLATARGFQRAGARTVLIDRSPDRLREAFKDIADAPRHLLAGGVDLSDPASLARLVENAVAQFGRIDGWVNTVGGFRGGKSVHDSDLADWDFLFNVNVKTTLLCCRAVIPQMLRQQRGSIVNVASRDGLSGGAGYAAYCASKSAVLRLTESLAQELKVSNINVNCVMPGTIDTPQNRAAFPGGPFDTWVEPAAIADVIQFLLSDAARAIHGAALPVFGKG